jgi:hypothetical protein
MILELVLFKQPPGLGREAEYAAARHVAVEKWLGDPDLIAKHFIRDEEGTGGAVYIWPDRAAAERAHDAAWRAAAKARLGNEPVIRIFELMMTADPKKKTIADYFAP